MLTGLVIQDVVLIDRLELAFAPGLTVLTGETGAGKSILLDALGLALGARAESGLIRQGAERATVSAEFALSADHPARRLLEAQGIADGDSLILRRQIGQDGRSRAFVNDQPVGLAVLREIAAALIEIEGQFEAHRLADPATHGDHLDDFGDLGRERETLRRAHADWREAETAAEAATAAAEAARRDADYLRHVTAELALVAPAIGEEEKLLGERQSLAHRTQAMEGLGGAEAELFGDRGAARQIAAAERRLERLGDKAGPEAAAILAALDRARLEMEEAQRLLEASLEKLDADPDRLERIEERLHALRDLARKHRCAIDDLPALAEDFDRRLAAIDDRDGALAALRAKAAAGRDAYIAAATKLSASRAKAAAALDRAIARELPALKLGEARFTTHIEQRAESQWSATGMESVAFRVATHRDAVPGPLERIASGGELARLLLALKVALAGRQSVPVLVFDEVDSGIGGATAAAVGERLKRLARNLQVLVVTHSPQVAAMADRHWRVEKIQEKTKLRIRAIALDEMARREEIARMLSGSEVTEEARAAAGQLLKGAA